MLITVKMAVTTQSVLGSVQTRDGTRRQAHCKDEPVLVRERLLLLAAAALERLHESAHPKKKNERKRGGKEERHQLVNASPADSPRVAPTHS